MLRARQSRIAIHAANISFRKFVLQHVRKISTSLFVSSKCCRFLSVSFSLAPLPTKQLFNHRSIDFSATQTRQWRCSIAHGKFGFVLYVHVLATCFLSEQFLCSAETSRCRPCIYCIFFPSIHSSSRESSSSSLSERQIQKGYLLTDSPISLVYHLRLCLRLL